MTDIKTDERIEALKNLLALPGKDISQILKNYWLHGFSEDEFLLLIGRLSLTDNNEEWKEYRLAAEKHPEIHRALGSVKDIQWPIRYGDRINFRDRHNWGGHDDYHIDPDVVRKVKAEKDSIKIADFHWTHEVTRAEASQIKGSYYNRIDIEHEKHLDRVRSQANEREEKRQQDDRPDLSGISPLAKAVLDKLGLHHLHAK
jgi:hypothetical protein